MNKGALYAVGAYLLWGAFPLYWKLLKEVSSFEILAHRVVWSFLFMVILVSLKRHWQGIFSAANRRTLLIYLAAGVALSFNWGLYIWGVNAGLIVEASLGYFINPLVSVLLGVIFLRERLPWHRWAPLGLAALGVVYLTVSYGRLPWLALSLAFTFGIYGLIKKLAPLGSVEGVLVETAMILIPMAGYLLVLAAQGQGAFGHMSWQISALLALGGVVTAIPLLLFSEGAKRIPLSTVGVLQYISPTCQFLLGVFVFGEPFTHDRLIGFGIIWVALIIYAVGGILEHQAVARREAALQESRV